MGQLCQFCCNIIKQSIHIFSFFGRSLYEFHLIAFGKLFSNVGRNLSSVYLIDLISYNTCTRNNWNNKLNITWRGHIIHLAINNLEQNYMYYNTSTLILEKAFKKLSGYFLLFSRFPVELEFLLINLTDIKKKFSIFQETLSQDQ